MDKVEVKRHTISRESTVLEAITMLNELSGASAMTLFVVDDRRRVIGSLTDGDIRRAMIKYQSLEVCVKDVLKSDFKSIVCDKIDVKTIEAYKKQGIKVLPVVDGQGVLQRVINLNNYNSILPLDAVLMAGGKGERLRPMTLTTPKPLLKVGSKPIIDYNVDNLLLNGVENISVTTNYLGEQLEEHFAAPRSNGVQVRCVREPKYLGTMGAVKFIETWHNDTILVMNSDLFTNINLADFFIHFQDHDAHMSIAAVPYSVSIPYGVLEIKNTDEIVGVKEKPSYHHYANAGIYLIKREMLDMIPKGEFFNATDLMQKMVDGGKKIIRFPLSGYWIDIGKPEDFHKAQDIANHINK